MSTHYAKCVVCGGNTACTSDAHVYGCGDCCDGGGVSIEFCSKKCFFELKERMAVREKIAAEEGFQDA